MQNLFKLDFPEYQFRVRQTERGTEIFDIIRRKFVALTPEEWVRQNTVQFLIHERQVPVGRMNVEVAIETLQLSRRADIVVFDNFGDPLTIVECKAPSVKITQEVFDQIARYNMTLKASYLFVTNGLTHFCCFIDLEKQSYHFLEEIPDYRLMAMRQK
jgi:type I site-specific restriction endonuclease